MLQGKQKEYVLILYFYFFQMPKSNCDPKANQSILRVCIKKGLHLFLCINMIVVVK